MQSSREHLQNIYLRSADYEFTVSLEQKNLIKNLLREMGTGTGLSSSEILCVAAQIIDDNEEEEIHDEIDVEWLQFDSSFKSSGLSESALDHALNDWIVDVPIEKSALPHQTAAVEPSIGQQPEKSKIYQSKMGRPRFLCPCDDGDEIPPPPEGFHTLRSLNLAAKEKIRIGSEFLMYGRGARNERKKKAWCPLRCVAIRVNREGITRIAVISALHKESKARTSSSVGCQHMEEIIAVH